MTPPFLFYIRYYHIKMPKPPTYEEISTNENCIPFVLSEKESGRNLPSLFFASSVE